MKRKLRNERKSLEKEKFLKLFIDETRYNISEVLEVNRMARKPFGGMVIKPDEKLAAVIGNGTVTPAQMTKKIWVYIKKKKLIKR